MKVCCYWKKVVIDLNNRRHDIEKVTNESLKVVPVSGKLRQEMGPTDVKGHFSSVLSHSNNGLIGCNYMVVVLIYSSRVSCHQLSELKRWGSLKQYVKILSLIKRSV